MTLMEIGLIVALLVCGGMMAFCFSRSSSIRAECDMVRDALDEVQAEATSLRETSEERLRLQTEAETRMVTLQEALDTARQQRDAAFADRSAEARAREAAEKRAILAEQAKQDMEARIADWETLKIQHLEAAKAAMLDTTQQVSSKLLEDHKREAETQKREAEAQKQENAEIFRQTTQTLHDSFGKLTATVASLSGQVSQTSGQTEQIIRALSNPGGAGRYAEIGLENMLREFGLEPGRDFVVQHTIDGQEDGERLRPDAVVFLPGRTVLTIDAKASKFLLEAAAAEGTDHQDAAYADLARTMNQHLRALATKDYASAIQSTYRRVKDVGFSRAINIMYLPSEAAIERLCRADPDFQRKAVRENIVIAGPTGLMSYIGFARIEIDLGHQAENQEKIVAAARNLIDAVGVVIGHVAGVGKGIKAAADSHARLVGSVNSRLLPRQRTLATLGVRLGKQRELPAALPSIQVVTLDDIGLIEGEAEEINSFAELANVMSEPLDEE